MRTLEEWTNLPIHQLPHEGSRDSSSFGALKEVDHAARREHCDWQMSSRLREDGIGMLVPDVQSFRTYATMLGLRCRLEIADGQYDKAAYTLQTILQFAPARQRHGVPHRRPRGQRHGGAGHRPGRGVDRSPRRAEPVLVADDLPRPFIDLRRPMEGEKLMLYAELPRPPPWRRSGSGRSRRRRSSRSSTGSPPCPARAVSAAARSGSWRPP